MQSSKVTWLGSGNPAKSRAHVYLLQEFAICRSSSLSPKISNCLSLGRLGFKSSLAIFPSMSEPGWKWNSCSNRCRQGHGEGNAWRSRCEEVQPIQPARYLPFSQLQETNHITFHKRLVLQLSEQVTPSPNLGFYYYQRGLITPLSLAALLLRLRKTADSFKVFKYSTLAHKGQKKKKINCS